MDGWMDAKAETITQSAGSGPRVHRRALGVLPGSQTRPGTRSQGNCWWQQRCGAAGHSLQLLEEGHTGLGAL